MKQTLAVKRESLPVRCEVCHQTDLFNPETGTCARCSDIVRQGVLSPSEAVQRWNVPESFHSVFVETTGDEGVRWVGRPVTRLARDWSPLTLLLLLPTLCLVIFGLWAGSFEVLFFAAFLGLILGMGVWGSFSADRRIDHTLYVLTEQRALVLRDDQPNESRSYILRKPPLRSEIVNAKEGIGHLIFFREEVTRNPFGETGWDNPVSHGLFVNRYDRGFFFIEDVQEVERIVRENIRAQGHEP